MILYTLNFRKKIILENSSRYEHGEQCEFTTKKSCSTFVDTNVMNKSQNTKISGEIFRVVMQAVKKN